MAELDDGVSGMGESYRDPGTFAARGDGFPRAEFRVGEGDVLLWETRVQRHGDVAEKPAAQPTVPKKWDGTRRWTGVLTPVL
jgi:hypothetical protein